ncbi:MAG: DUF1772 domain-containing protein [Gammaproteobacteria bacterium]|nr:DUF1772 domain-containing protein [Gammaproteobacteria bacterium]
MISQIIQVLEPLIQLSMIIMVGLYFIFSNTIMSSLKQFESGADVMVEINQIILNPLFMAVFWISGLGSLYLVIFAEGLLFVSGFIFLVGTTLVTIVRNVPLNNQLRDSGAEREQIWQNYFDKWVFWNHVRSVAAVTSGLLLVI